MPYVGGLFVNFKKKINLNALDYVIIAVAIIAISLSVYLSTGNDNVLSSSKKIEYTLYIDKIQNDLISNLKAGDILIDSNSGFEIGVVSTVQASPAFIHILPDGTNEYVYSYSELPAGSIIASSPDCSYLSFSVSCDAMVSGGIIDVNGTEIYTGKMIDFRTPKLAYSAECTGVSFTDIISEEK